jgi:uncharacterized membrane protein HdeD (DUF308 family)
VSDVATRVLLALIGVGLLAAGVLYATLGVWGVDRGGAGAWKLGALGLAGIVAGTVLLRRAIGPRRPSRP